MKSKYTIDLFDEKDIKNSQSVFIEEENKYITETAGYIPLEVKLKQLEQNGIVAQFTESEFTSNDYRQIYLNPDFDITPEDDLEDIQEKLAAQRNFIQELQKKKNEQAASVENTAADAAGSQTKTKQDGEPEEEVN